MLVFRVLPPNNIPWRRLDSYWDRTVFQTREWLEYLAETCGARPVVAEILDGSDVAGYFTGMTVRRFGARILGSPLPGWTTPYMGFNLPRDFPRRRALEALPAFAFGQLRCVHFEICDRYLRPEDGYGLDFENERYGTYVSDLARGEDEMFASMTSACRRNVRKAQKCGVRIEEANDSAFAEEYYQHLIEVFAKRRKSPTYGLERVRALIRHLHPVGHLLLVRARDPQGRCIATGIYPGFNAVSQFWGNGSTRSGLLMRPNEMLHWYAMRYWKAQGVGNHDWGGGGSYKEKYGGKWTEVPHFVKSRWEFLFRLRDWARKIYHLKSRLMYMVKSLRKRRPDAVQQENSEEAE